MALVAEPVGDYGKAVSAGDGMLHLAVAGGNETLCGKPITCWPLHWATTTVIGCGTCLVAAGVPVAGSTA